MKWALSFSDCGIFFIIPSRSFITNKWRFHPSNKLNLLNYFAGAIYLYAPPAPQLYQKNRGLVSTEVSAKKSRGLMSLGSEVLAWRYERQSWSTGGFWLSCIFFHRTEFGCLRDRHLLCGLPSFAHCPQC